MSTLILVPQGAEYQAVCRGLSRVTSSPAKVLAIPMGIEPVRQYLQKLTDIGEHRILMMGLCGSLSQKYQVGDLVLYQNCLYQGNLQECDSSFTADIHNQLGDHVSLVKGLTSDCVVCRATEKSHLHQEFGTDVVDMEGYALLEFFQQSANRQVAILRVVSDDAHHDIPDIASAMSEDGSLKPLPLAWELICQPLAATRLITGSLKGLKALTAVTELLFTPYSRSQESGVRSQE
ncbi:phosphorylase [Anabaena sp. UHCC 0187]|uniref:5'-methylthioadenosine/S-adenosylhomocysteine nucleosidase family protein n=1 Tax=Anabaena sp. UHCC 0187 TaxID=2590018 RepID=UPI001445B28A|nr:phosphorylase [Anabaena sp. UHCC 0187]MDP5018857.1 phosphorylase [Dolichospermum sp.]MTJ12578.1 phosphorylase [Anabaena sp. UHCC 0187]